MEPVSWLEGELKEVLSSGCRS